MLGNYNEKERIEIKNRFDEISNSMTRIEAERDLIKEIMADLKTKYEMPPKIARRLAATYHKRNIQEVVAEDSDFADSYDILFK